MSPQILRENFMSWLSGLGTQMAKWIDEIISPKAEKESPLICAMSEALKEMGADSSVEFKDSFSRNLNYCTSLELGKRFAGSLWKPAFPLTSAKTK